MIATKILCIVNPVAGLHAAGRTRQLLVDYFAKAGMAYDLRQTAQPGDAERWAMGAAREGFEAVLACGGDGTVTEVISGLLRADAVLPLAQLPIGTGNMVAKALGIPTDPVAALDLLRHGQVVPLDVAHLPDRQRYFVLIAGAGWDARLIKDAPRALKRRLGFAAYLWAGAKNLVRLRRTRVTLTLDGVRRRVAAHTVLLVNVGRLGGLPLGPDISPHDGKLDVIAIRSSRAAGVAALAWRLLTGRLRTDRGLRYFKAAEVRIEAEPPLPVEHDGEPHGETPLTARVIPSAARVVVPVDYADPVMGSKR